MGKVRAAVLIGVHVVIAIHITLWIILGRAVSPVEPSESMQTLELGAINAGFVFFSLALLSTLIFGRYFCGWGCHIVALQDFCGWIMKKCGITPRPFRSRLLLFVPLTVALYMFVWPNFKRLALFPAFDAMGVATPFWLKDVATFTGFSNDFIVDDFWATFVPWYLAIPYFFVVGFAVVYFLGAKGFCTYGCPYGGFFAPVEKLAPGRIRVTDDCEQCGHCTAVCTSNVRVHEEVHDFGMVIDPGCMKCMDCVSACPNDALYFGFGRPAIGARPLPGMEESARASAVKRARRWDLSWPEEIAAGVLFLGLFFAFRQFFYVVPMLMAVGLAGVGTFTCWKLVSLVRAPNVTVQNLQLKFKGRWKPAGVVFAAAGLLLLGAAAWGGLGRWHLWQGDLAYNRLDVPLPVALRAEFVARPRTIRLARAVAGHFADARTPWDSAGGVGYGLDAGAELQRAYALVLLGRRAEALAMLERRIASGAASDDLVSQAVLLVAAGGGDDAAVLALQSEAVAANPDLADVRARLAQHYLALGREQEARGVWGPPAREKKGRAEAQARLDLAAARFHVQLGERDQAAELARRAALGHEHDASAQIQAAIILTNAADQPGALEHVERALSGRGLTPQVRLSAAEVLGACGKRPEAEAQVALAMRRADRQPGIYLTAAALRARWGEPEEAASLVERAAAAGGEDANMLLQAGQMFAGLGRTQRGREALAAATQVEGLSVWDRIQVGRGVLSAGLASGDDALIESGLGCFSRAVAEAPGSATVLHDAGQAHLAAGRTEAGIDLLRRAAEVGQENAALAGVLADILEMAGDAEAGRWRAEAARRAAEAAGKDR